MYKRTIKHESITLDNTDKGGDLGKIPRHGTLGQNCEHSKVGVLGQKNPEALEWTMMSIIPKGGGEYKGIGLIEVICKVFASIVNNIIWNELTLHEFFHNFRKGRGKGTATIEENLAQKICRNSPRATFTGVYIHA